MALRVEHSATDRSPVTTAPYLRGRWTPDRITLALLVALAPPLAVALYSGGVGAASLLAPSVVVVLVWQGVFAWWRGGTLSWDGLVTATVFSLMLPADAPAWQCAIALSFGVVVGEQIFGGRGRNFLDPAVVALAFLIFSFPGFGYEQGGPGLALASLPGAALLILTGLISWRVVVTAGAAFVAVAYLIGVDDPLGQVLAGSFVFGVVFMACDPVAAASTNSGRWAYGLIVGGLTILGRASEAGDGTVFAVLIASMFAPLIDQAAIYANVVRRRRRNG